MNEIIGTLTITFCILLPVILFYKKSNWTKKTKMLLIIILPILWFVTYAFFHELSHMIGTLIVGGEIIDYQMIPKFWQGDFTTAFINPDIETKFQEFVVRLSPYFRDIILLIIGYLILKQKKINNPFVVGLILVLFLLSSLYDVINNFLGYAFDKSGDFNGLAKLIGHLWTYIIGILIISLTTILTYRIFKIYKGFPREEIKV